MKSIALLSILAAACATTPREDSPPKRSTTAHLVPLGELPKPRADLLAAYARGGEAWERARAEAVLDPGLTQFLVENLIVEMVRGQQALASPADVERGRRALDRARAELSRMPDAAAPALVALLEVSDNVGAELATGTLEALGRVAAPQILTLFDAKAPETRRRAAAALARVDHAGQRELEVREALANAAGEDSEWFVRAESALALGSRGARDGDAQPWRAALESVLADRDPAVAEAAAKGLGRLGDVRAVPALVAALERAARSGEPRVVRSAQASLAALTGFRTDDPAAWLEWWRTRGAEAPPQRRAKP